MNVRVDFLPSPVAFCTSASTDKQEQAVPSPTCTIPGEQHQYKISNLALQVNMLRDKIVELSRELADLRRRSKSCSGSLAPFPTDLHETVPSNNLISATADTPAFGGKAEGQGDWDGARASGGGSGELGTQAGPQGEQAFTAWQGLNLSEHTESPNWNVP